MKKKGLMTSLAWTLVITNAASLSLPINVYANASTNFDLRKKVIGIAGITAYSAKSAHPFQRNGALFRLKLSGAQLID